MFDIRELQDGSDIIGISLEGEAGIEPNLTKNEAGRIGGSFAWWLTQKVQKNPWELKICVGCDSRLSSAELKEGLMMGFQMFGAQSIDAGLATTPAIAMSTTMTCYDYDAAVMITAGDLPGNQNGFKFFTADGLLTEEDIAKVLGYAAKYVFIGEYYEKTDSNLMAMYAAHLRGRISAGLGGGNNNLAGMHIVVDAGNGAGGFFATEVLAKLGADVSGSQFLEPDGHFANHGPSARDTASLAAISKAVLDNKADLGIILDADVAHSAAVDDKGATIDCDERFIGDGAMLAVQTIITATKQKKNDNKDGTKEHTKKE